MDEQADISRLPFLMILMKNIYSSSSVGNVPIYLLHFNVYTNN